MPGSNWSVRTGHREPLGFGDNAELALETYDAAVKEARETGSGGSFELLKDGEVVGCAFIPAAPGRGETG